MSNLYGRYHHLCSTGETSEAYRGRFTYPMSRLLSDRAGIRIHEVRDRSTPCMFLPVPQCVSTTKLSWISWPSYYNVPPNSEGTWDSASVTSVCRWPCCMPGTTLRSKDALSTLMCAIGTGTTLPLQYSFATSMDQKTIWLR